MMLCLSQNTLACHTWVDIHFQVAGTVQYSQIFSSKIQCPAICLPRDLVSLEVRSEHSHGFYSTQDKGGELRTVSLPKARKEASHHRHLLAVFSNFHSSLLFSYPTKFTVRAGTQAKLPTGPACVIMSFNVQSWAHFLLFSKRCKGWKN